MFGNSGKKIYGNGCESGLKCSDNQMDTCGSNEDGTIPSFKDMDVPSTSGIEIILKSSSGNFLNLNCCEEVCKLFTE